MHPSLLTLLLDGLTRFTEPVFKKSELAGCDNEVLEKAIAEGVLKKSKRATYWVDQTGRPRKVEKIGSLLVGRDPESPGRDLIRIPPEDLEQLQLSEAGFARWVARSNSLEEPIHVGNRVWDLGPVGNVSPTRVLLIVGPPHPETIADIVLNRAKDGASFKLLIGGISRLQVEAALPPGTLVRLGSLSVDGRIDLTGLSLLPQARFVSNLDLSKQLEAGLESLRREGIAEAAQGMRLRDELADASAGADEFLGKLLAGFGSDKDMLEIFMLLRETNPDIPGRPLTFEQIGKKLGISKQAVSARFKKMKDEFPAAHRLVVEVREKKKPVNYSELSPRARRKLGIDDTYNYDAG